jgi:hypothetical protein
MPEQHLGVYELGPGLQGPSRVGMPELMGRHLLIDACPGNGVAQIRPCCVSGRRLASKAPWQTRSPP